MTTQDAQRASVRDKDWSNLRTTWSRRDVLAAQLLDGEPAVADIGCGLMNLRRHLDESVCYIPLDVVDRGGNMVVDLNREPLPKLDSRAAAVLGVVEYIDDLDGILRQLRVFETVVISYSHWCFKDLVRPFIWLKRGRPAWRHHLTRRGFEKRLRKAGFTLDRRMGVIGGESIYRLR